MKIIIISTMMKMSDFKGEKKKRVGARAAGGVKGDRITIHGYKGNIQSIYGVLRTE
jgi:hypothetical protein